MEFALAGQARRLDRHVRRSYLRIGEPTSRHRISYALEEALRLVNLPGEDEGRVYCFRRVSLAGISGNAVRGVWMERVQKALGAWSARAVHGTDPSAGTADAIYFNNQEEALEMLLRDALRARSSKTQPQWFSAPLLGLPSVATSSQHLVAILECLRPPSIPPPATAAILFAALGDTGPGTLLSAIPPDTVRAWVREMEGEKIAGEDAAALHLPEKLKTSLLQTVSQFGWRDCATVWLAAHAILTIAPNVWSTRMLVKRARATLRLLETTQRRELEDHSDRFNRGGSTRKFVLDDDSEGRAQHTLASGTALSAPSVQHDPNLLIMRAPELQRASPTVSPAQGDFVPKPPLLGEPTLAAGLPFLLNVLRRLGIAAALEACPALADADLARHIMTRLAAHAGVAHDDAILHCMKPAQEQFSLPTEVLEELPTRQQTWPAIFVSRFERPINSEYFLCVWVLAVKSWCWRMGRIAVREVVSRAGRVWLTRADLDVTLPFSQVDIRIRRIGLDIDPGWLPWFGAYGRVVRFHYRDREPETKVC